jgi:hypothetical protein
MTSATAWPKWLLRLIHIETLFIISVIIIIIYYTWFHSAKRSVEKLEEIAETLFNNPDV